MAASDRQHPRDNRGGGMLPEDPGAWRAEANDAEKPRPSSSDLSARLSRLAATTQEHAPVQATPTGAFAPREQGRSRQRPRQTGSSRMISDDSISALRQGAAPQGQPYYRHQELPKNPSVTRWDAPQTPLPGPAAPGVRGAGGRHSAPGTPARQEGASRSPRRQRNARGEGLGLEEARIAARKRHRRRVRTVLLVIVAVLAVLAGGAGLWFHRTSAQASQSLDQSLALIEQSDVSILALDQVVNREVTADNVTELPNVISSTYATQDTLDQALEYAQVAQQTFWLPNDQRKQVSDDAVKDINARKAMLENARQILQADYDAYQVSTYLSSAWGLILQADSDARASASTASAATTDNMETELATAIDQANSAKSSLSTASSYLSQASEIMPTVDFASIMAYVTAKQNALDLSIAADNAMLTGSEDDQAAALSAFQEADAQAVQAAQSIPTDLSTIITSAYSATVQPLMSDYEEARSAVAGADVSIRTYLGVADQAASAASGAATRL
ncbi:MAG: hypothetical protein SOV74_06460 [Coriobacteriales bacterium]|nr:hypothetical protein [Coriobacteriales bacterium]